MWNHNDLIFEKLEKILIQTTKTNWRVNRLEKDVTNHSADIKSINKRIYLAMWWLSILSIFWEKILESFTK
jgi:hypothetical protein